MPPATDPPRRQAPTGPVTLLCEGTHDAAFLAALLRRNGISQNPDLPFFWEDQRGFHQFPNDEYGEGAITLMLTLLAGQFRTEPAVQERVRGIILVRDGNDAPARVFESCRRTFRKLRFAVPREPGLWSEPSPLGPRLAVLLVPGGDRGGGLETLCLDYLRAQHPDVVACIDQFFRCVPALSSPRTTEKQHKAELACAIAGLRRETPTISLAHCFGGSSPFIDVTAACFQQIVQTLCDLYRSFAVADPHGT